jgi:hypothetical protein
MSSSNLNESQKSILRWIVNEAWNGNLDENEIWFIWSKDGTDIMDFDGKVPEVKKITLESLEKAGFLICQRDQHWYKCALTSRAYEAVENNFETKKIKRDDSYTDYLKGLNNLDHLDKELKQRCLHSISNDPENPTAWDKAIRTATVVLEERLRKIGETEKINPAATADTIVNIAFSERGKIAKKIGTKEAKAYRDLYAGLMLVFRNKYNHRLMDPTPTDGAAIIQFVNLALKMLNDIEK